ncbi:MAG: thiamine-phosphate kinase, partial [Methanobacteriota archaeon]
AAMGAGALGLVFSVALPRDLDVEFVNRIMKGMDSAAKEYDTYVVGGDLDENKDIVISGTAFGLAKRGELLRRSGAKEGDILAITGELGAAAAGLKVLMEKVPVNGYRKLVKAQLEPKARVKEGMALARSGCVKAAIDVSDGLATNLWHLARESKAKLIIERDKIPIHPLVKKFSNQYGFKIDDFVLFGGEDFELIFTTRPKAWHGINLSLKRLGTKSTAIGKVSKGRGVFIRDDGKTKPLEDRGYEHFK